MAHDHQTVTPTPLLPCPFCGGDAAIEVGQHNFNDAQIRCISCGLCGPGFDDDKLIGGTSIDPKADAIAHWNTRSSTAASALLDAAPSTLTIVPNSQAKTEVEG